MILAAADTTNLPAFLALAGVVVMAAVQWRTSRDKQRLAERTAEASSTAVEATNKADIVTGVLDGWKEMVKALSVQNAAQQVQISQVRAVADRCEAERAELLARVSHLEQPT